MRYDQSAVEELDNLFSKKNDPLFVHVVAETDAMDRYVVDHLGRKNVSDGQTPPFGVRVVFGEFPQGRRSGDYLDVDTTFGEALEVPVDTHFHAARRGE